MNPWNIAKEVHIQYWLTTNQSQTNSDETFVQTKFFSHCIGSQYNLFIDVYISSSFLFAAPPLPPESLRVTNISRDAVTLAWETPDADGGTPVKNYVIERKDAARGAWTTVGTVDARTRSYQVRKLLEGNQYHFRVMAENDAGMSDAAETSQSIEVKSPFGKLHFTSKW